MKRSCRVAGAFTLGAASLCAGATNIDPAFRFAWGENIGWINWRDGEGGAGGIRVHATFLAGFAWAENVGWINFGEGSPVDGIRYANSNGLDFGVNMDPATGDLAGFAWGENIGWVNFDTAAALSPSGQQARLDRVTHRFHGYAWGENIGWINLDDAAYYVAYVPMVCQLPFADHDGDNDVDQADFGAFQVCFSGTGRPAADHCECFDRPTIGFPHGDNDVDLDDLAAWTACSGGPGIPPSTACGS